MMRRVGFIGLGDQGAPIAARIAAAGYELHVWARRSASVAPFAERASVAGDPEELGRKCDVVCLCVRADADLREVAVDRGLLGAMAPGSVLVNHMTVRPETVREIASLASARGVEVLDAPVSGGRAAAEAGTLTVIAGGEEALVERCRPLLESFASSLHRVGRVGDAQLCKLLNNLLFTAGIGLARQALRVAEELGMDRAATLEVLRTGSARSFALETLARPATPEGRRHGAEILEKDLALVRDVARVDLRLLPSLAALTISEMREEAATLGKS